MKYRQRASKRKDKRYFSRTADRTHKKNLQSNPMRGGIRL